MDYSPPPWLLPAIGHIETHSQLVAGHWARQDHKNDRDSQGAFQCRPIAFADVYTQFPGHSFSELQSDDNLGAKVCLAYVLKWRHAGEPWAISAMRWNAGPTHVSAAYLAKLNEYIAIHCPAR